MWERFEFELCVCVVNDTWVSGRTHSFCLQIARSNIKPQGKWAVSLVITNSHLIFLRVLYGYACVKVLYLPSIRWKYNFVGSSKKAISFSFMRRDHCRSPLSTGGKLFSSYCHCLWMFLWWVQIIPSLFHTILVIPFLMLTTWAPQLANMLLIGKLSTLRNHLQWEMPFFFTLCLTSWTLADCHWSWKSALFTFLLLSEGFRN